MLGDFKFTYTSASNLHTQVLANAIADLPIRSKYIPLTKNNENIALERKVNGFNGFFIMSKRCGSSIETFNFTKKLIF